MSIALVVTRGYGNGTLTGTIKDVVTAGYTIGQAYVGFLSGNISLDQLLSAGIELAPLLSADIVLEIE